MLALLIIILLSPFLILLLHGLLSRFLKTLAPQVVAIYAGLALMIPLSFLIWFIVFYQSSFSNENIYWGIIYCFIVYSGIAYSYFHLFNMSETARRIKILRTIYLQGACSKKSIEEIYDSVHPVEIRLDRLLNTKILFYRDGYYLVQKKTLYWVSCLVEDWRRILGFK